MQVGVTPVIIAQQVEWVTQSAWRIERDGFARQMESWRTAWESLDTDRYLAYYARDFRSDGMNIAAWSVPGAATIDGMQPVADMSLPWRWRVD